MAIEPLTDEERAYLQLDGLDATPTAKALRIIDAHAADRAALVAQLEAAMGGNARAREEARQLRERLAVEESGRTQSETLLRKTAWRLEALHNAANAACCMWERTPNSSLHDIRMTMRALRDVLNKPNLRTNPDAALVAQVAELTRERDEALRRPTLECARATEAEVARLTDALAEVRRVAEAHVADNISLGEENIRLQSALAAERSECNHRRVRAEAAEARARELEARIEEARAAMTLAFGPFLVNWPQGARDAAEALRG